MKHSRWLNMNISGYFKQRRFNTLDKLCNMQLTNPKKKIRILDVGCAEGKDLLRFIGNHPNIELYGFDIKEYDMINPNVHFHIGDASNMDFEDNYFDLVFSIGTLEHVQPIEKLSDAIKEIERVSKEFYIMVPAITTPYEPHAHQFFWGLRRSRKYHPWLMFFDDLTWLKFSGLKDAYVKRFWYIPGLISNLIIYKNTKSLQKNKQTFTLWKRFKY